MNRIDSLDWQRGLLAFAIMAYHLAFWEFHELDSSSILDRFGIYGVSMFFVLSGLSMALVYNGYIQGFETSLKFLVRRVFRIWPLLWFAIAFATGAAMLAGQTPNWGLVVLNLTTAFGFVAPSAYLNIGAWSIGNEVVYYALTPIIIFTFNKSRAAGNLMTVGAMLVGAWFAIVALSPMHTLADQSSLYINPFNNLFLYCGGIALYYNFRHTAPSKAKVAGMFIAALAVFCLYPVHGDQIQIVTGAGRLAFSLASFLLVLAFYKNQFAIPAVVAMPLTHLGVMTYGVYLLHPIAYRTIIFVLKKLHTQLAPSMMIGSTIVFTIILALVSFRVLEAPLVRLGKKLTARKHVTHDAAVIRPVSQTPIS